MSQRVMMSIVIMFLKNENNVLRMCYKIERQRQVVGYKDKIFKCNKHKIK